MKKLLLLVSSVAMLSACSDFFEQESDHVIYADQSHLDNASDTIWSVAGIMNKLQALTDRTVLLGEMRADLMDITDVTNSDLRDVALFNVGDDNRYNQPRDYYAVINNCNYFIANADTALRNNRNQHIFLKEYAAVKAFRAWTYLQLVLNYGQVPFVTEPILTKEAAENYEAAFIAGSNGARKDIAGVCDYFINDLKGLEDVERPGYGTIRNTDSRLFYFPIYVLLGELNLWAGHYRDAAWYYYQYISKRNGLNSSYPTGTNAVSWYNSGGTSWLVTLDAWSSGSFYNESFTRNGELITMMPMDSIPSEGNYSQLRNIFNSTLDNDLLVSAVPSQAMFDLSAAQTYCMVKQEAGAYNRDTTYAPAGLSNHRSGDLRLSAIYSSQSGTYSTSSSSRHIDNYQQIQKYASRNVHLWRRTMVYAHMAEALNAAGFPRFAYALLATGVNNRTLEQDIIPYYPADSTWLRRFDFPTTEYVLATWLGSNLNENTQGLHNRGCGFSPANKYYRLPDQPGAPEREAVLDSLGNLKGYIYPVETAERVALQQEGVEKMLIDELGLEFAFEGQRYYDLMRFALRRGEPAFLAERIYNRRGAEGYDGLKAEIEATGHSLYDTRNWYLKWQGKIGY
ncbi:MAG: RagB/SusD family nutrient uptake outer membrane protein [Prevotella sp.]|nr:RagB/SusD family nutrient uptake outer membrane protein [Prevotella sp.]